MPTLLTLLYFGYLSRNSIRFLASVSLKLFASQQSDNSAEADLRKVKKNQESPYQTAEVVLCPPRVSQQGKGQ